ncbi:MAG: hypothetical protein UR98_C0001G0055 [Parcubacteria group bacterium GW2011_GWA1_36_12]|nr:MAG: hypothetical protein UR98_C0001G0055 [Parcubacteria group bacterium GW2011_GWA1_36_12]
MPTSFKKGIFHASPIVFILIFLLITAILFKKNIHTILNAVAWQFGINLNNIQKDSYVNWIKNQNGQPENTLSGIFLNKRIDYINAQAGEASVILGEQLTANGEKWIEVDLSDQRLYMKEGDTAVGNFLVSTGKWYPTPTGEWRIWTKLRYTRMKGGSKALGTFYDLPNVPFTMYYYKGYGIHGAYWHSDFGTPRSHGCVNMKPDEAGIVYSWANVGTRVVVHQ